MLSFEIKKRRGQSVPFSFELKQQQEMFVLGFVFFYFVSKAGEKLLEKYEASEQIEIDKVRKSSLTDIVH